MRGEGSARFIPSLCLGCQEVAKLPLLFFLLVKALDGEDEDRCPPRRKRWLAFLPFPFFPFPRHAKQVERGKLSTSIPPFFPPLEK